MTACGVYVIPTAKTMASVINTIVLEINSKLVWVDGCSLSHLEVDLEERDNLMTWSKYM